jgi:hypothetical protein
MSLFTVRKFKHHIKAGFILTLFKIAEKLPGGSFLKMNCKDRREKNTQFTVID